ncbi:hypothetical protein EsH8_I_000174 [Colletotrichum jinshuiense]
MHFTSLTSVVLASLAVQHTSALPTIQENTLITVADSVKADHPEAYAAFLSAPLIQLDLTTEKRQTVPEDGTPDPDRPVVTPDNIFVLQCSIAGFQGECLSFGAPPGRCVNYSSYNQTQAFLDKYDNQTSSLSSNTGGLCQFYK